MLRYEVTFVPEYPKAREYFKTGVYGEALRHFCYWRDHRKDCQSVFIMDTEKDKIVMTWTRKRL